ncbi:MAG: phosphonate C-P lyase system protein PhnG [Proteobacteria bacterium]|nr:phosphonate C-P lyase system protein PhnG [Pseudomonadota bacterium]
MALDSSPGDPSRKNWMGILARASETDLENFWQLHGQEEDYDFLRRPEIGLVMVQGRAGGTGGRFNLGEMTVTRCSVRLSDGTVGHAYIAGRNQRHAELAAAFDALLQNPERQEEIEDTVITPLQKRHQQGRDDRSKKAAATKVDFYTMVRGED